MGDSLDLAGVTAALAETIFTGQVRHLPSVGSTNALALEAAQAGGWITCRWNGPARTLEMVMGSSLKW